MDEEIIFSISALNGLAGIKQVHEIRRLTEDDCELFNEHLTLCGQEKKLVSAENWRRWLGEGTEYFLLFEDGKPVTRCGIERYSADKWEAGDVRCAVEYRKRGLAAELVAYVTKIILESGKIATCRTLPDNHAMLKVMEKVGYR